MWEFWGWFCEIRLLDVFSFDFFHSFVHSSTLSPFNSGTWYLWFSIVEFGVGFWYKHSSCVSSIKMEEVSTSHPLVWIDCEVFYFFIITPPLSIHSSIDISIPMSALDQKLSDMICSSLRANNGTSYRWQDWMLKTMSLLKSHVWLQMEIWRWWMRKAGMLWFIRIKRRWIKWSVPSSFLLTRICKLAHLFFSYNIFIFIHWRSHIILTISTYRTNGVPQPTPPLAWPPKFSPRPPLPRKLPNLSSSTSNHGFPNPVAHYSLEIVFMRTKHSWAKDPTNK